MQVFKPKACYTGFQGIAVLSPRFDKRPVSAFNDASNRHPSQPEGSAPPPPPSGHLKPSVPVRFKGTVIRNRRRRTETPEQHQERLAQEKTLAGENQATLKQAVQILSQSPTGRHLLEQMTKEGYQIIFDDRRTASLGAAGLCDPTDKMIILSSGCDAENVALILGHEAAHALQDAQREMLPTTALKPEEAVKLSFAIEADAYAHQVQIALELAHGDPKDPKNNVVYPGPLRYMRHHFGDLVKAAEAVMACPKALENGAVMAAAFQGFYDNYPLRSYYEDAHLGWVNMFANEVFEQAAEQGKQPFSKTVSSKWIKENLHHNGKPYLKNHCPNLDFNEARYSGLTPDTIQKVYDFYKKWTSQKVLPVLKEFGLHMKDAVNMARGTTPSLNTVVFDKRKKPPYLP